MAKKYDAGVKEYRETYWMPEYTPADTDILACFKITPQPGVPREEAAAAVQSMLFYSAPLGFAILNLGNAILSIFVLYWSGRVFGGTGDLSRRKLIPGLFHRFRAGQAPEDALILAAAHRERRRRTLAQLASDQGQATSR